ncbi:hypothetical protein ACSBR1_043048 [Camellia fascicularis]
MDLICVVLWVDGGEVKWDGDAREMEWGDNDKEDVIKLLLSDGASGGNQKIDVIAIVGMGRVSKTTLAQFLYNDGRVDDHFDMKAWVCVSDEFNVVRVTRTILEAIILQGSNTMVLSTKDLNQLQVKLKEYLSGKKFLIILDDVWNENYDNWDSLRSPFGYGEHGSRVIVTTRNESISSIMQTVSIHRLQQLSDEDCWKLFAKHVFEKGDCGAHLNLGRTDYEFEMERLVLMWMAEGFVEQPRTQAVSRDFCYMLEDNNTHHISERFGNHSWLSKKVLDDILPKLTFLRTLSFPCYKIMELPHSIGNLLHLRYLDLSYMEIKYLPESVCTMYNLETLLLYNCHQLTTLLVNLQNLIRLRHLDITGTNLQKMSMQMSQLKGLQLLNAFVVGKSKGLGIEELKEFRYLQRRLSILSLQNVTNGMGAMEAKLEEKMYLKELVLRWSSCTNDSQNERDVLDKLKPHTNLKRLKIKTLVVQDF